MWAGQRPTDLAAIGVELPENLRPMDVSVLSQASSCSVEMEPTIKVAAQKLQSSMASKDRVSVKRSVFAPVDGSQAAGALTTMLPGMDAIACPTSPLSIVEGRKRSADLMQVFDDFHEERSRSRIARNEDSSKTCAVPSSAPLATSTDSAVSAALPADEPVGPRQSEVEDKWAALRLMGSAQNLEVWEDDKDADMEDATGGVENTSPPTVATTQLTNPGVLSSASGIAGLGITGAWERAVFRDLVLDVPPEYQDHPDSDIDSDADEEEDMAVENLADTLQHDIFHNKGGCYEFEIYQSP